MEETFLDLCKNKYKLTWIDPIENPFRNEHYQIILNTTTLDQAAKFLQAESSKYPNESLQIKIEKMDTKLVARCKWTSQTLHNKEKNNFYHSMYHHDYERQH